MRILIVGGGVIGTSIAYHLAARGADVIVIERSAIACAASGKSGGFLAMDWCDGTPLMQLARRSFALHAELAEARVGEWGYRRMTTYGGVLNGSSATASRGARPGWLSPNISIHGQLGSTGTTAQVQPAAFTVGMMRAAEARGAELRLGNVTGLLRRGGEVVGVDLDGETLEGDAVVIAMGPWSVLAAAMAVPPARVRVEGAQPCLRDRNRDSTGGAVSRIRRRPAARSSRRRSFPVPMARRMCVRSRATLPCRQILVSSCPTMVRSTG